MRLTDRKLLTLLIAMTSNPSENISDEFMKTSKIRPSMESWNGDFLQFSATIIKSFVLSNYLVFNWRHFRGFLEIYYISSAHCQGRWT